MLSLAVGLPQSRVTPKWGCLRRGLPQSRPGPERAFRRGTHVEWVSFTVGLTSLWICPPFAALCSRGHMSAFACLLCLGLAGRAKTGTGCAELREACQISCLRN